MGYMVQVCTGIDDDNNDDDDDDDDHNATTNYTIEPSCIKFGKGFHLWFRTTNW